jgi:hypothetical protein
MSASSFEHSAAAQDALRVIVADPEHGLAALDSTVVVANLLQDLLPDAPRESSVLVAAASAGVPAALRSHVAQGLHPATAIRLAAAVLESRTAYPAETCEWAAREYAMAIGIDAAVETMSSPGGRYPTELATAAPARTMRGRYDQVSVPQAGQLGSPPAAPHRRVSWIVALAIALAAVAVAVTALTRNPARSTLTHHHASASSSRSVRLTPRAAVEAYVAAVNQHNWRRAWALGGKNLGTSYRQMVAGYAHTSHLQIIRITVTGGAVTVVERAPETNGLVQRYRLSYLVSGGIITAGQSRVLSSGR